MTSNHCYLYHPISYYGHEFNPKSWTDGAASVFVCVCEYVQIHLCVCVKTLKWRSVQRQNCLLSFMPFAHVHKDCQARARTHIHTRARTHLPLLKRHIQWIYCVLSCCLLWMGTAAYLQWIVNPAEHSAVRVLWIANMLYLALPIPPSICPYHFHCALSKKWCLRIKNGKLAKKEVKRDDGRRIRAF